MNARRLWWAITLLVIAAMVLSSCGGEKATDTPAPKPTEAKATEPPAEATEPPVSKEGTPYRIGFAPSVTGGGAFLGEPERNVAEIIAARLEEAGGIVGPDGVSHKVEILIGDTESNPDVAVSVARRYVDEDEVVTLVMGSLTPMSLAIAEVAEETEVPYVSMASSVAIITDPDTGGMRPWVFKTPQSNGDVATWQVERLTALGSTSVCYLYENTGYGKDCFNSSSSALEAAGFETAYSDSFERTDTEFPQVISVQAAGCDVVVVGAIPPGASMATIALRDALPDIPIVHGHGVCTEDFIATAGAAAEGVELPCSAVIIAADVAPDHPQKGVFTEFYNAYTEYTGEPVNTFGGHAWDGLMWVIEALESLPDGLTLEEQRAAVRDYIETNIVNWPGTAGVFTITPDDHYGLTYESFDWFKVENGTWVPFPREEWAGAPAPAVQGVAYRIGFAPSVTGGGAFLGEPERNVAEIIAARLEEAGGIVGPDGVSHKVEILIGDTESNPDVAVSVARRYVDEDEVVTLVMGSLTPMSLAIAEVAEETEVPYVSMASSVAIITDPDTGGMRPWVFKTPQSNGDVATWQVERLTALGATSVCYLYENTGYGKDCFNSSSSALEAAGFETAYSDSFERTDTEFPQVISVQAAGCDVVVVGAIPPGASMATIALRDALPDVPIIHGHGVCTEDFITTAGAAAEGVELPCSAVIIAADVAPDHPQKEVFTEFYQAYTEYTGEPVNTFGGHGWDGLMWVIEALESLPDGLTLDEQRAAVRDYIETNIVNWPGTAGVFTITPDDHYGLTYESFTWFKVENDAFAPFPSEEW